MTTLTLNWSGNNTNFIFIGNLDGPVSQPIRFYIKNIVIDYYESF